MSKPNPTRTNNILVILCFILSITTGILLADKLLPSIALGANLGPKNEILELIRDEGIKGLPTAEELKEGELKGLVAALDDPYSEYLTKEDSEELNDNLNERYEGVGLRFTENENGDFVVTRVFSSSPAQQSGVKVGDLILNVDGESLEGLNLTQVANKIKGELGTKVTIEVSRNGQKQQFTMQRSRVQTDLVNLDIKGDVAIIEITSFGKDVESRLGSIAQQIKQNTQIKRIVLDLRGNTGGLLDQSIQVSSYFLPNDTVVVREQTKTMTKIEKTISKEQSLVDYPLAVVTDSLTASASEIVAAAVRDNRGVKIVGQKTFGKGVVQRLFPLRSGDYLKLTIANWYTSNGQEINGLGLNPDVEVKLEQDAVEVAIEKGF